jgi:3-methylcrotonyl-CoA carboxylase alpha subunit
VRAGQTVQKGDALLILEAMKMENVLKATRAGEVTEVRVAEGDAVEKGAVLLRMS